MAGQDDYPAVLVEGGALDRDGVRIRGERQGPYDECEEPEDRGDGQVLHSSLALVYRHRRRSLVRRSRRFEGPAAERDDIQFGYHGYGAVHDDDGEGAPFGRRPEGSQQECERADADAVNQHASARRRRGNGIGRHEEGYDQEGSAEDGEEDIAVEEAFSQGKAAEGPG